MSDDVYLLVVPADGKCEGCREPLGEEMFEDVSGLVLCRGCWNLLEEELGPATPVSEPESGEQR